MEKHSPHKTVSSSSYIGFWHRFGGSLIDGIVINIISFFLTYLLNLNYAYGTTFSVRMNAPTFLIGIAYFLYFWTQRNGQTLGAKLLGFKIVREDGKKIDIGTAIIRYIGYIVSGIVLAIGFLWVIWDKKKQGWHDKMAGTIVIKA